MSGNEKSAMLPAELRNAPEEKVDEYLSHKMESFDCAMELSDTATDPVRRWIARECIKLAIDPRVDNRDVRARSAAMLSASKVLGLDRDIPRFDVDATTVESALKRLRDTIDRGEHATGGYISEGAGVSPEPLPDGSQVLLCESSVSDQ